MDIREMFKKANGLVHDVVDNLDGINFAMFQSIVGMIVDYGCAKYGVDNVKTLENICEVQKMVTAELGHVKGD